MLPVAPGAAREIDVGPNRLLKVPSQAATVAGDGDVVRIDPGEYADCAVWRASHLTIESTGPGVRIAGKTCAGKGIFITAGSDILVRGITFADAQVPDHNGAGIRAEGDNLTVENSRFEDNENGILAGGSPGSVLRVEDSVFSGNGACIGACAHGIYAGAAIRMLDVRRCVFWNTKVGHHIKSRALNTLVVDSTIEDGDEGTASYLIDIPNGGNVLIEGNTLQKGPRSENHEAAISIGEEKGAHPTRAIVIRGNRFRNDFAGRVAFVRNDTGVPATLTHNEIVGDVVETERMAR